MRFFSRSLVFALGLLVVTTSVAQATDLCVTAGASGITWVGKKFTIPPKNQCKPFIGFREDASYFLTGMGCTRADGGFLRLQFTETTTSAPESTDSIFCGIPLPSLSGGSCVGTLLFLPNGVTSIAGSGDISASRCTVNVP